MTREPGDLPFEIKLCRAGCSGRVHYSSQGLPWQPSVPHPISIPAVVRLTMSDDKNQIPQTADVTIFVCTNCREASDSEARPGIPLLEALSRAAEGKPLAVKPVTCLANCEKSPSAAFNHRSGWSYVFGHLSLDNVDDIVAGAMMLAADERGFLPLRGRPACLRGKGMTARNPPLHHKEDMQS